MKATKLRYFTAMINKEPMASCFSTDLKHATDFLTEQMQRPGRKHLYTRWISTGTKIRESN
jgi:hypothetical protein